MSLRIREDNSVRKRRKRTCSRNVGAGDGPHCAQEEIEAPDLEVEEDMVGSASEDEENPQLIADV